MTEPKLFPFAEIVGAVGTSQLSAEELASFKKDPHALLQSHLDIDASALELKVVENSDDEVHLSLPYFASIESASAGVLDDSALEDTTGGEIFITLLVVGGAWVGGMIGVAAGTVGTATGVAMGVGAAVGGAVAAGTIAGAAAGGVHESKKKGK